MAGEGPLGAWSCLPSELVPRCVTVCDGTSRETLGAGVRHPAPSRQQGKPGREGRAGSRGPEVGSSTAGAPTRTAGRQWTCAFREDQEPGQGPSLRAAAARSDFTDPSLTCACTRVPWGLTRAVAAGIVFTLSSALALRGCCMPSGDHLGVSALSQAASLAGLR